MVSLCYISLYKEKGPGGSRQDGEGGDLSHFICELHMHMNNV